MALASHVQEEQHVGRQQSVNLLDEDVGHARLELTLLFVRRFRTKTACLCICFLKTTILLAVRHAPVDFHLPGERCYRTALILM